MLNSLADNTLLLYIEGNARAHAHAGRALPQTPQAHVLPAGIPRSEMGTSTRTLNRIVDDDDVDPDDFAVWGFEQLLHHRIPLYQAIAAEFRLHGPNAKTCPTVHTEAALHRPRLQPQSTRTLEINPCPSAFPTICPPATRSRHEGVMVMTEATAARQDIRPLQIGLLNLMPNKIKTETQFARLIGATPLQVELTLVKITSHTPKNTSGRPHDRLLRRLGGRARTRSSTASSSPARPSNCSNSRT